MFGDAVGNYDVAVCNGAGDAEGAGFDSVGGEQLSAMIRSIQKHGAIASFGNAGGIELHTTVLPFILRGVRLIGVDSAATPMDLRRAVWARLAGDLKRIHLGGQHIMRLVVVEFSGINRHHRAGTQKRHIHG